MSLPPIVKSSKLKILRGFQTDFLGTVNKYHEQYGDTFMVTFPFPNIFTRDPVILKHILHDNFLNYPKKLEKHPFFKELFYVTNNANSLLFTSDFDFWRKDRQIATPSFLPTKLAGYVPRMVTFTEEATDDFEEALKTAKPLNVKETLGSLTLKNMLYNLFEDCDVNFKEFHYQMKEALNQINKKGNSIFGIRWLLPTKDRRLRKKSYSYVQQEALRIIEEREKSTKTYEDLLSRLLKLYSESFQGDEIKKSLVGEMIVYLIAGHDTTASTLNAFFMYFSLYPEIEKKILEEMQTVLGDKTIDYETANQLVYTKMAFQEALRLQTPISLFNRKSEKEDHIAGFTIPADMFVALNYRGTNRNTLYWDDPEAFNPERFREKRWGQDEQYAYVPFGGGPRLCIGMNFAFLEAMVTLAVILPKYRLTLMPGRERKDNFSSTTWPGGAEEMMVSRRK